MPFPTARTEALRLATQATRERRQHDRDAEETARRQPIRGEVVGRNPITGADKIATPDGGVVEAFNLGSSAPVGEVPLQRVPGSQQAAYHTPVATTSPDLSALQAEVARLRAENEALRIGGGHLLITAPQNATYVLIRKNEQPRQILDLDYGFASGTGTAVFSHEKGEVIGVGDSLSLALGGLSTDGSDPPEITATGFSVSFKFG